MAHDGSTIKNRLEKVNRHIEQVCTACGRDPATVRLIAVTKTHPVRCIEELVACGHRDIGENRVQEILEKIPGLPQERRPVVHLIGHLQTNKVAKAVTWADWIQSVDSERLHKKIELLKNSSRTSIPPLIKVKSWSCQNLNWTKRRSNSAKTCWPNHRKN